MTSPYLAELFTEQRSAEFRQEARAARLVALASCCRPSTWGRALQSATTAVARLRTAVRRDTTTAACCTA